MRNWLLMAIIILAPALASAQRWSVNLSGGFANYTGDLQGKRFTTDQAGIALGAGALYDITPHLAVRAGIAYLKVGAADKYNRMPDLRARNLDFSSNITEGHLGMELFILDRTQHRLAPYVFGGVGVFHFNPYTYDSLGAKHELQPLRTEGQGLSGNEGNQPYNRTQLNIPFGAGIRWALSDRISLGWELGLRKTFTDYLDDVSTNYFDQTTLLNEAGPKSVELAFRGGELKDAANPVYPAGGTMRGSSRYKDWYYNSSITLHIRLFSDNGSMSSFGRKKGILGCPKSVL